jgi:flagellar biosynthetic protein FlhB
VLDRGLNTLVLACGPLLGAAFVVALVAGYAQIGSVLSFQPLKPDLRRLDPIKNAKNIFGKQALFELFKSLVKVVGIGYVAFVALWDHLPRVLATVGQPPERSLLVVSDCLWAVALRVLLLAGLLSAMDLLYQRWRYRKRMMMSKVEVQREQKEMEGDPQRKAERRRLHQEILDHQTIEAVATADCVVINPEHVAVALRYDEASMSAPKVLAKGRRLVAAKIRQIARQHGIPIVRNVPLARALVELELDEEIPPELYETVAEVLRFVYRIGGQGR